MKPITLILALLMCSAALAGPRKAAANATAAPASAPSTQPAPTSSGIWYQPISSFDTWKARGFGALIGYDSGPNKTDTLDAWCAAANAKGMRYYLQCYQTTTPGAGSPVMPLSLDPVAISHAGDSGLIGYLLPDEPNGAGNLTADQCQALYVACKAAAPKVPVVIDLDAGHVQQFGQPGTAPYIAACDVVCFDAHPINYNGANNVTMATLPTIAASLKAWGGAKPLMEIFEGDDEHIYEQGWCKGTPLAAGMRGPTGAEITQQVTASQAAGVTAIGFFCDAVGNTFAYDGTNADQLAAIVASNATVIPPPAPATLPAPDPLVALKAQVIALQAVQVQQQATIASLSQQVQQQQAVLVSQAASMAAAGRALAPGAVPATQP